MFFTALSKPGFHRAQWSVIIWCAQCLENHPVLLEGVTSLAGLGTHLPTAAPEPLWWVGAMWHWWSLKWRSKWKLEDKLLFHLNYWYGEVGPCQSQIDEANYKRGRETERAEMHQWPKRNPSRWLWCMSSICLIYLVSAISMWSRALDCVSGKSRGGWQWGRCLLVFSSQVTTCAYESRWNKKNPKKKHNEKGIFS